MTQMIESKESAKEEMIKSAIVIGTRIKDGRWRNGGPVRSTL